MLITFSLIFPGIKLYRKNSLSFITLFASTDSLIKFPLEKIYGENSQSKETTDRE